MTSDIRRLYAPMALFATVLMTVCAIAAVATVTEDSDAADTITVGAGQSVTIDLSDYLTSSELSDFNSEANGIHCIVDNIYCAGNAYLSFKNTSGDKWVVSAPASAKAGTYTIQFDVGEDDDSRTIATTPVKITEGTGQGTESSPLSSVSYSFNGIPSSYGYNYQGYHRGTLYVEQGASVSYTIGMASYAPTVSVTAKGSSGSSASYGGISVSVDSDHDAVFSGTMGSSALTMHWTYGAITMAINLIPVTSVESVSITGPGTTTVSGVIGLAADILPSTGGQEVEWTIVSGDSYISLEVAGACKTNVRGVAAGTAVVKAASVKDPSKYATHEIRVSTVGSNGTSGGSGTESDPYIFQFTAGESYSVSVSAVGSMTKYYAVGNNVHIPGMTFATASKGSTSTLPTTGFGGVGIESLKIDGTPTTSGEWLILAFNPANETYYRIIVTDGFDPVEVGSITIDGPDVLIVGEYATWTATVSPGDADYKSIKWTVTGAIVSSDIRTSDTDDGGTCELYGSSEGEIKITATARDGSGASATKTISSVRMYFFTLKFDANGGNGAPDTMTAADSSPTYRFSIPQTIPTKEGYTFHGWSESSTDTSSTYYSGNTFPVSSDSPVTLYAVWLPNSYESKLYFNANGGEGAPDTQTDTHTTTSAHTFTIPTSEPARSGFVFMGWSEDPSASSASYRPGGTISVPYDGSKTLYAVWQTAKLNITSEPTTKSLKVGQPWSYTPIADFDGCTVTVSGADWLSVSDGKISGTPTTAGSYSIVVTVSKTGYTSDAQSFTLNVYSILGFDSEPGASGIFAYAE